MKLFPQNFGVVPSEQALTESQYLWLQCQMLLDEGMHACPSCDALSQGDFCPACGTRTQPEPATCGRCQMTGSGAFCQHCGAELEHALTTAITEGTFDWDAWVKSLTPFLGGLTPQEEQLMART